MTTTALDFARLQVQAPTEGFILGRSLLGDNLAAEGDALTWNDWTPEAGSITVARTIREVGTITVSLRGDATDADDGVTLRPSQPIRLTTPAGGIVYEGQVQDVETEDSDDVSQTNPEPVTTVVGVDATNAHVNTTRYGAVSATPETFYARVNRLSESATMPIDNRDLMDSRTIPPNLDDWERALQPVGVLSTYSGEYLTGVSQEGPDWYSIYAMTDVGDLVPGWEYTITLPAQSVVGDFAYRLSVDQSDELLVEGPAVTLLGVTAPPRTLSVTFTATAETHRLYVQFASSEPAGARKIVWGALVITNATPDPYRLRSIVYEGALTDHLNIACDSVGGFWWVDRTNMTRVRRGLPQTTVMELSDVTEPSYAGLLRGFNTRNLVNDLTVTNLGRTGGGEAIEDVSGALDETSIATWGRRSGELRTSLDDSTGDVATRAAEVLAKTSDVARHPQRLRISGQVVDPSTYDLYDLIGITRKGVRHEVRIEGIEHTITAHDWVTELTVGKP